MKPCPFCGGPHHYTEPVIRTGCKAGEPDAWASSAVCATCGAEGPWRKADTWEEANRRAEAEWNRRPTESAT